MGSIKLKKVRTLHCKLGIYVNVVVEVVSFPTAHNGEQNYPAAK